MNTITYPDFYNPPKFVLEEEVDSSLFTGRRETLQRLWDWVMGIDKKLSNSLALMSPRRYGKTALLLRLFKIFLRRQRRSADTRKNGFLARGAGGGPLFWRSGKSNQTTSNQS